MDCGHRDLCAFIWFTCLCGPGDDLWVYTCCFFAGVGGGVGAVLPSAMQADIVDYDEYTTVSERKVLICLYGT